jgi:hypothetical protein
MSCVKFLYDEPFMRKYVTFLAALKCNGYVRRKTAKFILQVQYFIQIHLEISEMEAFRCTSGPPIML